MAENVDLTVRAEGTPFVLNERANVDGFVLSPDNSPSVEFQLEQVTLTGSPSLVGPQGEPSIRGFGAFIAGKPLSSETLVRSIAPYDFTIDPMHCVAEVTEAAGLNNIFNIFRKRGSTEILIGTFVFEVGDTNATFNFTHLDILKGDRVTIVSPVIIDGDLENLTVLVV